jgi:hypothetical protein
MPPALPSRVALVLLGTVALPHDADARVLAWRCDVTNDAGGRTTHTNVRLEPERLAVSDNNMLYVDGSGSVASDLVEYVKLEAGLATWGVQRRDGTRVATNVTLDLQTGAYAAYGWVHGRIAHGTCRNLSDPNL